MRNVTYILTTFSEFKNETWSKLSLFYGTFDNNNVWGRNKIQNNIVQNGLCFWSFKINENEMRAILGFVIHAFECLMKNLMKSHPLNFIVNLNFLSAVLLFTSRHFWKQARKYQEKPGYNSTIFFLVNA